MALFIQLLPNYVHIILVYLHSLFTRDILSLPLIIMYIKLYITEIHDYIYIYDMVTMKKVYVPTEIELVAKVSCVLCRD